MFLPSPALLQGIELSSTPSKPAVKSPTGIVFGTTEKILLLTLAMAILYLRLFLRRRKKRKICPHCGKANPPHQTNCMDCSAPLFPH